jgi:hypothetical protein
MKLVRLIKICLNETYIKIQRDATPIKNGLKQGRKTLLPFLSSFALEYAIRKDWN